MTPQQVKHWADNTPLVPSDIDCTTAVMLKILDGKCRMLPQEKAVMTWLYDELKNRRGTVLGPQTHSMIASARQELDEAGRMMIYEQRVLAETRISRPVMKAFKAMIRRTGLFDQEARSTDFPRSESHLVGHPF